MEHQAQPFVVTGFNSIGFSEKVRRCVGRARTENLRFEPIPFEELRDWLQKARQELTLATDEAIKAVLTHNPDVIRRVVRQARFGEDAALGFFAYLPLNDVGYQALAHGEFDGLSPQLEFICKPGEVPVGVYLWLIYLPAGLGQSLAVIAKAFDELAPEGCAVFSRAVNPHAVRLNRAMGFVDARIVFPNCTQGLLAIFPERPNAKPLAPEPVIGVARTWEDMAQVMAVRSATYLAEQHCLYREEFDGNDFCATHLIARVNGDAAGCVRIRFFADFAKIERLAVRPEYRNSKTAYRLARSAVEHAKEKGYKTLYGHSRLDLVRFWRCFGFKEREGREDFSFANVRYRELVLETENAKPLVSIDSDPLVIIRPEGAWDMPGPLDPPATASDRSVLDMMTRDMRTVRRENVVS